MVGGWSEVPLRSSSRVSRQADDAWGRTNENRTIQVGAGGPGSLDREPETTKTASGKPRAAIESCSFSGGRTRTARGIPPASHSRAYPEGSRAGPEGGRACGCRSYRRRTCHTHSPRPWCSRLATKLPFRRPSSPGTPAECRPGADAPDVPPICSEGRGSRGTNRGIAAASLGGECFVSDVPDGNAIQAIARVSGARKVLNRKSDLLEVSRGRESNVEHLRRCARGWPGPPSNWPRPYGHSRICRK